jgi:RHS repeat-associated protein
MREGGQPCTAYYELDTLGNIRRIRAGRRLGTGPTLPSDLGGYAYTAFGKTLPADAATPAPTIPTATGTAALNQQLRWQSRWFSDIAGGLYDFRARTWSPELGAFLQPDDFRYLYTQRAGLWTPELGGQFAETTLWSWPGQNPIRYRDPSGRFTMVSLAGVSAGFAALATAATVAYTTLAQMLSTATDLTAEATTEDIARHPGQMLVGVTIGAVSLARWVAETSIWAQRARRFTPTGGPPRDCETLYETDQSTCRAISRARGPAAAARCWASAGDRYGACLAGRPIPPLDIWNN